MLSTLHTAEDGLSKDLVLIGGGHANSLVLKQLAEEMTPSEKAQVRVTLICDCERACYSGMLPGTIAGLYEPSQLQISLRAVCDWCGCSFIYARALSLDRLSHKVKCMLLDGSERIVQIPYDLLSIDVGSTIRGLDIEGVQQHAITTRPVTELLEKFDNFDQQHQVWSSGPKVVVVGAGAAGVELAMAVRARYKKRGNDTVNVKLINSHPSLSASLGFSSGTIRNLEAALSARHIEVVSGVNAAKVSEKVLFLNNGNTLEFDMLLWATGAAPVEFLAHTGLDLDARGFLQVDQYLLTSDPSIFAAGDCVCFTPHPVAKAGVYAVREGPIVAQNLMATLRNKPLHEYEPQTDFLALLATGDGAAVASVRGWFSLSGWMMWKLKDSIDTKFMKLFDVTRLPTVAQFLQEGAVDVEPLSATT